MGPAVRVSRRRGAGRDGVPHGQRLREFRGQARCREAAGRDEGGEEVEPGAGGSCGGRGGAVVGEATVG